MLSCLVMRLGIIGTRGIPNYYGGFEQFAQYLSVGMVERGHEVFVYNSQNHPYKEAIWNKVNIIHKQDPEHAIGTAGQFVYDLNCILDARKRKFDVILNLGYTSSSIWIRLFPRKSILVTNMDGLEWKRTKFSKNVQKFLMYAERLAVKNSDLLVADSLAIQAYIEKKYKKPSHFIAYGAHLFTTPKSEVVSLYNVMPYAYTLLIARMEPENNIEIILEGVQRSFSDNICLVVGNFKNKFGTYLVDKFKDENRIVFVGPVYDLTVLNNLRYYCRYYFHGHSVGGTNPSLLEAMACNCLIVSHNNEFNKSVLGENALYFDHSDDITSILNNIYDPSLKQTMAEINRKKIETTYSWTTIINAYESLMLSSIKK